MQSLTNHNPLTKKKIIRDGIQKLIRIDSGKNEKEYAFHKQGCHYPRSTPFQDKEHFYIRGKSSSNSVKYQCKHCKKITNVLPENIDLVHYYQQQRDYLKELLQMIISNLSMNEICSRLQISNKTYYHKLELISNQLTQFQSKIEDNYFENKRLDNLYINTNVYGCDLSNKKWKMIVSCDFLTGYIYRCDIEISEKNLSDFYTNTAIPHFFMLSRNKNVDAWFFMTPNQKLYEDAIQKSLINEKVTAFKDSKEDQLTKYLNYLQGNVKRFNSPYVYYYINIFKVMYNFTGNACLKDGKFITPAQMLNLTNRNYEISDLLEK
ncbi:MAG: hypothetical protein ACOWWR_04005 [Eubacteriales bacterium]